MSLGSFKRFFLISSLLLVLFLMSGCTFYQYIAHYANQYGWKTKITIQNTNSTDVDVTLNFYDNNGNKISTAGYTIPAYGFKTDYVENLFPDTIPETGSIEIVSVEPGFLSMVSSIILFEYNGNGNVGMGGLQSAKEPARVLTFPWFENSTNFTTGIAILNVSGHNIVATLKAFSSDGNVYYSKPIKLSPFQRIIGFPSDFFDVSIPNMATLEAVGTGNIVGFIIMYNPAITKVEAINGETNINRYANSITYEHYVMGANLNSGDATKIGFTRDNNKIIVSSKGKGIYFFNVGDVNNPAKVLNISSNYSGKFAISPDGKKLIIPDSGEGKIYEYDLISDNLKSLEDLQGAYCADYSNDGNYLAVGTVDGKIKIFTVDLENDIYTEAQTFSITGGYISCLRFTEDSSYLMAADNPLKKLYYISLGGDVFVFNDLALDIHPRDIENFSGVHYVCGDENKICKITSFDSQPTYISVSSNSLSDIDITPDGKYILGANFYSTKILKYDLLSGEDKQVEIGNETSAIAVSPNEFIAYVGKNNIGYLSY